MLFGVFLVCYCLLCRVVSVLCCCFLVLCVCFLCWYDLFVFVVLYCFVFVRVALRCYGSCLFMLFVALCVLFVVLFCVFRMCVLLLC